VRAADRAREDVIETPWSAVVLTAIVECAASGVNGFGGMSFGVQAIPARLRRMICARDIKRRRCVPGDRSLILDLKGLHA